MYFQFQTKLDYFSFEMHKKAFHQTVNHIKSLNDECDISAATQ